LPQHRRFSPVTNHQSPLSSLSAAKAARWVLAHFSLFVKELGAQLAQFFAAAVLELSGGYDEGRFVLHGDSPPKPNYLKQ
jgi:hypothetical protein